MVQEIEREHPEYRAQSGLWARYRDLYAGGEQFRQNAREYLVRRHKEPADVYGERLERTFYENYVGSIIDWYATTLFRREPILTYEGQDDAARKFFNQFTEDCDLRGTPMSEFFRRHVVDAMVAGRSYILIDFPRIPAQASTRAEEDLLGKSRAYLSSYPAESVINWQKDERGELEWAVIRTERRAPGAAERTEKTWIRFDRKAYAVYREREAQGKSGGAELAAEGPHALAALERVPLMEFTIGDGMWLMNKAAMLQLEHFDKSNALAWALTMGLFAMPVVYSEREFNQILGESYYLQLGKEDRFGWTEPEGHVFEIAQGNLERLREEIYRVCYLLGQAGGPASRGGTASGLSKQRDYAITQEVLRGLGDAVKDGMKRVLRTIAAARQDRLTLDVSGLDEFDIGDFSDELDDAARLLNLGIESPTLRKQVFKKLAFKYLCDVRQEMKDRIAQEIDEQE